MHGMLIMWGLRIPVFRPEVLANYTGNLLVVGKRALHLNIEFSQEGLCSGCQRKAQGGKDELERGARVNDFKPLGELRADPVPMKSSSIVSLYKMFGCKPTAKLGCFCARLLL